MKSKDFLREAEYPGNIGAMEVFSFYKNATPEQKEALKKLLDDAKLQKDVQAKSHCFREAWKLIQQVTGMHLAGSTFNEAEDVGEWQLKSLIKEYNSPHLYESIANRPESITLQAFLKANAPTLVLSNECVGNVYFPVNMLAMPPAKILTLAQFKSTALFCGVYENQYVFKHKKLTKKFPEDNTSDELISRRLVFTDKEEYSKFLSFLLLSFEGWSIKEKYFAS